jgi:hypothetical protein
MCCAPKLWAPCPLLTNFFREHRRQIGGGDLDSITRTGVGARAFYFFYGRRAYAVLCRIAHPTPICPHLCHFPWLHVTAINLDCQCM